MATTPPDVDALIGVKIESIRQRLDALTYFTAVRDIQGGAEAIEGMEAFVPPAAFVSVAGEAFDANRYAAGGFAQRSNVSVSVLFCIPSQRMDGALNDEVEQAKKLILLRLIGWTPEGADKPMEAQRYSIRLIADGYIWAEWIFRTAYDASGTPA